MRRQHEQSLLPLYEVFVRSKTGVILTVTSAVCTLPMIKWRWRMPAMLIPAASERLLNLQKASEIVASQPEDRGDLFDPAESKVVVIRLYTVPDGMEHM